MPVLSVKRKFHYKTKKYLKTVFDNASGLGSGMPEMAFPNI